MYQTKFKLSTSRKSLHKLSARQRFRVMCEIRCNLKIGNSSRSNIDIDRDNNREIQDFSVTAECNAEPKVNFINTNCDIRGMT